MITLTLTRKPARKGAILGILQGLSRPLSTLEGEKTTWPAGTYICTPHGWEQGNPHGFTYTQVWEINKIPKRDAILFHWGNFIKNTLGCVLVGLGESPEIPMVTYSMAAINLMRKEIGQNSFKLVVK